MQFPIDLSGYTPLKFELNQSQMSEEQRDTLQENIRIVRDSLVFFTALANVKGLGGHTGGAYDIVPELLIADGFMKGSEKVHPVYFDEAGHRVAIQYMMAVLNGYQQEDSLLHYREFGKGYYGHPEREDEAGVFFSSGRLGHMWSYVNGVAEADREKIVVMFGSDGSQMEGDDSEAARYAAARNLNVKLLLDDNDVTIAGHPTEYMKGYDLVKTLEGHAIPTNSGDGENLDELFGRIQKAFAADGPVALVNRRKMAIGVPGIEGLPKGHDVIPVDLAVSYLKDKGYKEAVEVLETFKVEKTKPTYLGSTPEMGKCRDDFGKVVCDILDGMQEKEKKVLVVDSDLEGSCGLHHIRKNHPEVYVTAGIMERNNYSVAAGFGSEPGRQGIFGTFAAFQEMVISEVTMARLNKANVIAHFSHSGVDDMADNTCHFGINNFFADNALAEGDDTRLYFPADTAQLRAILHTVFNDQGLRFVYSTRSATPWILGTDGEKMFEGGYTFIPGKDEVVREGTAGYIVSYGEMLYRCLDVVEQLKAEGIDVGLINKPTLNVVDEEMMARIGGSPFVLTVETQNSKTGLGVRFGTWLLERGFTPKFGLMGSSKPGQGGLGEQIPFQGMGADDIKAKVRSLIG
ncbi:transketolase C-terminal domain-containing protein [Desulfopila sp. IMCC35008]|uniref:transketolase C-terminal domain-containing protein n=1 Tax=Desulfopila sp. IMCC35008 TaxID=2653858 RepID=UPI0013D00998|nr:transketolase C-terminal domain-containing protein [Desulfopila sp. IMCC35008]